MGSAWYHSREGRERVLGQILKEDYKYLIVLVGTRGEEQVKGAYQLFKELDQRQIKEYAASTATENGIKLVKIEVWSLEAKLLQELQP